MPTFQDALLVAKKDLETKLAAINALLEQPTEPARRGRKPMSAAARKAHSLRMKALWARRRKESK